MSSTRAGGPRPRSGLVGREAAHPAVRTLLVVDGDPVGDDDATSECASTNFLLSSKARTDARPSWPSHLSVSFNIVDRSSGAHLQAGLGPAQAVG